MCEDAALEAAANSCASTGFTNSGQSCISVQRIYVPAQQVHDFNALLKAGISTLRVGDPLDMATDVGSMVDEPAAERVSAWVTEAVKDGAELLVGGDRSGATLGPTAVSSPPRDARIVNEEVFGPLVVVLPYTEFTDVLAECNRSPYGLQAGIFTTSLTKAFDAWRELEVGGLVVNGSSNFRLDHLPFGGTKDSGTGRETPSRLIQDFTYEKTLILRGVSLWTQSQ